ncbi:MAG: amidohydrolase family protein, partial [Streptomycetales bacterium]
PGLAEVDAAACRWVAAGPGRSGRFRLADPVLIRHLIWTAARRGLPLQVHTGFGDPDLHLLGANPLHLTALIRALAPTGTTVLLLHCYPYHREAAYLASVHPHVAMDVGLAVPYVGVRASAVLAEALELAPFHKLLYASDGFGLPELLYLGAVRFLGALEEVLAPWVNGGEMGYDDACRLAGMVASGNARRVYAIE